MKKLLSVLAILTLATCLNGCSFFSNLSNYRSTTETFTNSLINRNFDKCVSLMNMGLSPNIDLNQFKVGLDTFRNVIVKNFGTKLEYTFMSAEKKFSTDNKDNLPPNTTLVMVEFHNDKDIGVLQVLFDDKTGKIDNIKALDVKQPIPDMSKFWLFGFLAAIVIAANIYTIVLVKRSDLRRKWLSYIAIILLNVPTIEYHATDGIFFKLLHFQFLLGISFSKAGYLGSVWAVGIPVGAIFILWRLSSRSREITAESLVDQYGLDINADHPFIEKDNDTENM